MIVDMIVSKDILHGIQVIQHANCVHILFTNIQKDSKVSRVNAKQGQFNVRPMSVEQQCLGVHGEEILFCNVENKRCLTNIRLLKVSVVG